MNLRIVAALVSLVAPSLAEAHGIGVEVRLKGDRLAVEGYFDDNTAATDATVKVTTEGGETIAEGKTDAKGLWSFPAPPPGKYRISLDGGGGHLARATLTVPGRAPSLQATPAPVTPEVVVSDGPTRADGGRRWLLLLAGLGIIGLFAAAARWLTRRTVPLRAAAR